MGMTDQRTSQHWLTRVGPAVGYYWSPWAVYSLVAALREAGTRVRRQEEDR